MAIFIYLFGKFAYRSIFIDIYKSVTPPFIFLLFERKIKFISASVSFFLSVLLGEIMSEYDNERDYGRAAL